MANNKLMKRLTALMLTFVMIFGMLPLDAFAATSLKVENKVADNDTINGWQAYFGANGGQISTEYAGAIWTDKSVYASGEEANADFSFLNKDTVAAGDNFLVSLSALSATKEIVGYSNIPTDTVLVLDLSNSMSDEDLQRMTQAANAAIEKLYATNNYNRVGIVTYNGKINTLLEIDRYTASSDISNPYLKYSKSGSTRTISVSSGVKDSEGHNVSKSINGQSGTYTQAGIYHGLHEFLKITDTSIETGLIQGGTKRIPVMVLMTDGDPTYGSSNYLAPVEGNKNNRSSSYTTNEEIVFLTQLTAAFAHNEMTNHYGRDALFYTLGLGVSGNYAPQVLNPELNQSDVAKTVNGYWETYRTAATGTRLCSYEGKDVNKLTDMPTGQAMYDNRHYVDRYFAASNSEDLVDAFDSIVEEIILQSKYYPTLVSSSNYEMDGYVSIVDELGEFMEVKSVRGMVLDNTLYSGKAFVDASNNGEYGNLTTWSEYGWELVYSLAERLNVTNDQAITLLRNAWAEGQIGVNNGVYSNRISYYVSATNENLGFRSDSHTPDSYPEGTKYLGTSYLFQGLITDTGSNLDECDMLHIVANVFTDVETGHQTVTWRIPAALVPMVQYKVTLPGTVLNETVTNIKLESNVETASPIRFLYEVGLIESLNPVNFAEKMAEAEADPNHHVHKTSDGGYEFFSNRWGSGHGNDSVTELDPNGRKATVAHFEPSHENERYFYAEDAIVYSSSGTAYKGTTKPSGNGYVHYQYAVTGTDGTRNATVSKYSLPISRTVLASAVRNEDGTWYIPKGTVYRAEVRNPVLKDTNKTGTIPYVDYPYINSEGTYDLHTFLGNNGRLKVYPAQGIKLTKNIDVVEPGTKTDEFVFDITFSKAVDTAALAVTDAVYNPVSYEISTDKKVITVKLANTQSVYITGLETGITYTITEREHQDYVLDSFIANNTGTVAQYVINSVEAVNTRKGQKGDLVITKTVTHPYGVDYTIPSDLLFEITVELKDYANQTLTTTPAAPAGTTYTTDENGKVVFTLAHSQSIDIHDLPTGTEYRVYEATVPAGFTSNGEHTGTIIGDQAVTAGMVNTYQAPPIDNTSFDLTHIITKTLEGRPWQDTDEFVFELFRWDEANRAWVTSGKTKTVKATDVTADGKHQITFELTETFSTIGTYWYKTVEVNNKIPGVAYSTNEYVFGVVVTDDDMDGDLEVSKVIRNANDTEGYPNNTIEMPFTNVYSVEAQTTAEILVNKVLDNPSNATVDYTQFGFELYADAALTEKLQTVYADATGNAKFVLQYTQDIFEKEIAMFMAARQAAETTPQPSVEPSAEPTVEPSVEPTAEPTIEPTAEPSAEPTIQPTVEPTTEPSVVPSTEPTVTPSAEPTAEPTVNPSTEPSEESTVPESEVVSDTSLTPAPVTVKGEVSVNTMGLAGGAKLALTPMNNTGDPQPTEQPSAELTVVPLNDTNNDQATGSGESKATPEPDTFTKIFYVKEIAGSAPGMSYDPAVYKVTVTVTGEHNYSDNTLNMTSQVTYELVSGGSANSALFTNKYEPTPAPLTEAVKISKEFTGRDAVKEDVFTFHLYETDSTFTTGTTPAKVVTITGEQLLASVEEDGTVKVELNEVTYSKVGNYYAVIKEVNGGQTINGVKYDAAEYWVTIQVSDNKETGKLEATATMAKVGGGQETDLTAEFVNTYSATGSPVISLSAKKSLTGRPLYENDFTFSLYSVTAPGAAIAAENLMETAGNTANQGIVRFKDFAIDTGVGTYYYAIVENNGGKGGITYDTSVKYVKVEVYDNGKGEILATTTYVNADGTPAGEPVFNNSYAITTPASVTIRGHKLYADVNGNPQPHKDFTFVLIPADEKFVETSTTPAYTAHNDANGNFAFTISNIGTAGTWNYVLREVVDNDPTVSYDETKYYVTIVAFDNGDGTITAIKEIKDVNGNHINKFNGNKGDFVNIYYPQEESADITIIKQISNDTGATVLAEGFKFGLFTDEECTVPYKVNGVDYVVVSDSEGAAPLNLNFTDKDVVNGQKTVLNFYIKELAEEKVAGMQYDDSVYKLVVTLEYVEDTATATGERLSVTAEIFDENNNKVTGNPVFTNIYDLDPVTLTISGDKVLTGKNIADKEFSFALYNATYSAENGWARGLQIGTEVRNDASGNFAFPAIGYTTVGTYYYIVREITPAADSATMSYDRTQRYITVSVTDGGNGKLKAEIVSVVDDAGKEATVTFTNKFTPAPVIATISGKKVLTGRDWADKDRFIFDLYETGSDYKVADGAQPIDTKTVTKGSEDVADGKLYSFDPITFTADKLDTRYFVVRERQGGDPTIKYSYERNVKITAAVNMTTGLIETVVTTWTADGLVEMENIYTEKQASATVAVQKEIINNTGVPVTLGGYQIGVYTNANCTAENLVATLTTDASGYVTHTFEYTDADFNPITDNASEKVFTYYLKEIVPAEKLAGMTYDGTVYTYTVTLSYNEHNVLVVNAVLTDGKNNPVRIAEFVNTYTLDPATAVVSGNKALKDNLGNDIWNNTVHSGKEFTVELYRTNDTMNYATGSLVGEFTVKRTATGYKFTNSNTNNALTFDKAGTYYFAVREKYSGSDTSSGKYPGVRYDGKEYGVAFVVDRGTGDNSNALVVTKTTFYLNGQKYTGNLDFENIYTITGDTTVEFSGNKVLTGRDIQLDDFTFQLFNADENWTTETVAYRTAQNAADGSFTFGSIHYDAAGTYRYVIKEVVANNPTITYDNTEYRITVTVSDNGDGTWTNQVVTAKVPANGTAPAIEKGKTSGVVFNNTYTTMPATATVDIDKILINNTGVAMDESGFVFQLYTDAECTKPVEGQTAISDAHGKASITLNFTDKDLLTGAEKVYYLKEVAGIKAGMEYSDQVYRVTITLAFVRNGNTTALTATPVITLVTTPETHVATAVATFTNVYKLNPTEISIPVEKVFTGRDASDEDKFTFRLYSSPTRNYADGKQIGTVTLKNGEKHIFKDIEDMKFTQVGTYYFIAVEDNGGHILENVKFDATQYVVKVVVTDDGNGNLAKAVTYGTYISGTEDKEFNAETVLKFTNTYVKPGDLMLEFDGIKELTGRAPKDGEFDFLLYETGSTFETSGSPIGHVTNDESGKFYFDGISFTDNDKGTHYYVIKEFVGVDPAITYSVEEYRFTVTVDDDTTTGLVAKVVVTDKAGNAVTTAEVSSNKVNNGEKELTLVKVTDIKFTNTYIKPADASVSINIDKIVIDNANAGIGKDGFEFGLYEDARGTKPVKDKDNNHIVAMSNNNGDAVINMTFTAEDLEAGTVKTYYLKETKGNVPGMIYSTETYKVVITLSVVKEAETVKLVATPVISDVTTGVVVAEPHFTNAYSPKEAYGEIKGTKVLTGRDWTTEDTFTILLYATGADHNIATGKLVGKAVVTADNKSFEFTNDMLIVADALKFTTVGMHHFTVVEEKGATTENGIHYDSKIYGVGFVTEVVDGQLVITRIDKHLPSTDVTDIVFENIYHVHGDTSAEIKGTKTLTGRNIKANEFSFALYQTDSTYIVAEDAVPYRTVHTTTSGVQSAQFTFGQISYNKAGDYYYVIKEVSFANPAITYDNTVYKVKVTVSDNGQGEWNTPEVEVVDAQALVFNNKYTSQSATAVIPVIKQLTDNTGTGLTKEGFVFGLYTDENCTVKAAEVVSDVNGNAEFSLSYNDEQQGNYTYYIKEIAGNKPGMAYDNAVYKVDVNVQFVRTDSGVELVATPEITLISAQALYSVNNAAVFHNLYQLAPAYLDIPGVKVLPQHTILDSDFIFQLYNATVEGENWTQGALVQEAANIYQTGSGKDGDWDKFMFDDVEFEKAGTYHFIITEKAGNLNGVTYDESQYRLTVNVAPHAEKAELVAEITEIIKVTAENPAGEKAESVVFNNEYAVKGTFSLNGIKTIVNRDWTEDDEFTFAIYETGADFKVDKNATTLATTTSTDGTFTFADIPVENTPDQFTGPTYDGVKHYYVVKELAGTDATMTYDDTVYRVTVETKDNLDGTLTAGRFEDGTFVPGEYLIEKATEETVLFIFKTVKTESAPEIRFVNVYNTQPVKASVNGTKVLVSSQTDRQIKAGEFTFQLWTATIDNGRWHEGELVATTTNNAPSDNGAIFTFSSDNTDRLTFTQAGEYLFIVKEAVGTNPIVGYDDAEYNVKIDVAVQDNPETAETVELAAKVYLVSEGKSVEITDSLAQAGLMAFENRYNDTAVTVEILKQLMENGKAADTAEGFTFVVTDENGKVITDKLISAANGITAHTFFYDEEDIGKTYTYKVYEKAGNMKGMVYDDTVYIVVVKLTEEDGVMYADVTVTADGAEYVARNLVFTNTYTSETPYVPDTGDNTGVMLYAGTLAAAAMALIAIILLKRKKREE